MTKGTGNFHTVWTLVSISTLGFVACTSQQVAPARNVDVQVARAPDVEVHFPVIEQRIFVQLPGNTRLNAYELRGQYRSGRRTISHVRQRCVLNPTPSRCTETTDVRISAVEGAKYVNPDDAPNHPQLIAWIENLGTRETYDGIEPMSNAIYALVVDSHPKKNPRIIRVRFPATRAAERTEARTTDAGNVYPCHNYGQPFISDADFQSCSPYPLVGLGALHSLSARAMFASASTTGTSVASDPTWFSCSSGCCSASAFQAYAARRSHGEPPYFSYGHLLALGPSASH